MLAICILCFQISRQDSRKFWYETNADQTSLGTRLHTIGADSYAFASNLASQLSPQSGAAFVTSITHKVRPGETIAKIWKKFGSPNQSALLAERALKSLGNGLHLLKAGEELEIKLSDEGEVLGFDRDLGKGKSLVLDSSHTSGYSAAVITEPVDENERIVSGTITSSLFEAATREAVPYEIIDQMVDLFSDKIEFTRDLQVGDTFTVVYNEKSLRSGETIDASDIKAAAITNNGKMLAAISYPDRQGKNHYYDQDGVLRGNYFLRYPLKFTRISSVFTQARFHPILGINRPHNGVDFAAPIGTAVRSVADGTVEFAGFNHETGNMIKIRHDERYSTAYLHLSSINHAVRKGARVSRGEVIGAVGMTGLATGPHLHFSLFDRGVYTNPLTAKLPVLTPDGETIPKAILAAQLELLREERQKTQLALNSKGSNKPA